MRRFLITVAIGALVYTGGSIITPQEDNLASVFAPITGSIFTAIIVAVILLPLRAGLRALMPRSTPRTHGIAAASALLVSVAGFSLITSTSEFVYGRSGFWAFWSLYCVALVLSFFRPLATQNRIQTDSVRG